MTTRPKGRAVAERRIEKAYKSGATELSLAGLDLSSIPESLWKLDQLDELDLADNDLGRLPDSIGQLTRLRSLNLGVCELVSLPKTIGRLRMLRTLNLAGNRLRSLPYSFRRLKELRYLNLWDNRLSSIPSALRDLPQIEVLLLRGNPLGSLPEWLGELAALEELHLEDSRLSLLPESLANLQNLERLYLHGNDELGLPQEVLGPKWEEVLAHIRPVKPAEIIKYYFSVRADSRPLNEAKLILVGHGEVGKTSLVKRLVHGRFNRREKKTEGIQITKWSISLSAEEDVRFNIWDFGGQEIMHSTHRFFLTQRSLYLVVLNGRKGNEDADAEYWLNLISSFAGDSPVIVVLNKIKGHPFDLNRRGLMQKYPALCDFIETDCGDNTGIDELRQIIQRQTVRLEHLHDAFPASWLAIKERLAKMPKNYMSFSEYRSLCEEHGEKDKKAQESLALYLHNLGIALNFKDDPRLRDTRVLNPHWVTKGIYTILNSQQLAEQKGVLHIDDLSAILKRRNYPKKMHRFLLDLMQKFELCFGFPEAGSYLIPELLDKQQPAEADEFRLTECLNFQYHYPILPEGLLPRFIVRTHVLSAKHSRWRTGVILEFEGSRALVKTDVRDRRVLIAVACTDDGGRRLLAIIRSDFEYLHRSFKFEPREMIGVPDHPQLLVPYEKLLMMERSRIKSFPEVVGSEVLNLDVEALLDSVDLKGTRKAPREIEAPARGCRLFYSYSHADEQLRYELEIHLKLLERLGMIEPWHASRITAGDEWRGEIDEHLERADIILLLVSAHYIASDYCWDVEMTRALERHEAGEACVVPVIVRAVNLRGAPFGKLLALPEDGRAVETYRNRDEAWSKVAEGIEKLVERLGCGSFGDKQQRF